MKLSFQSNTAQTQKGITTDMIDFIMDSPLMLQKNFRPHRMTAAKAPMHGPRPSAHPLSRNMNPKVEGGVICIAAALMATAMT